MKNILVAILANSIMFAGCQAMNKTQKGQQRVRRRSASNVNMKNQAKHGKLE